MPFWWIAAAVLGIVGGNLLLRAGMLTLTLPTPAPARWWRIALGGLVLFAGVLAWMVAAALWGYEWTYIALGLSYVVTILCAWWFIGETLTLEKMVGAIIIVVGTLLIVQNSGL